jgi:hypothetical protein
VEGACYCYYCLMGTDCDNCIFRGIRSTAFDLAWGFQWMDLYTNCYCVEATLSIPMKRCSLSPPVFIQFEVWMK